MTDSFHGQIILEKLDTFAAGSQDFRELWAVRPHAIFVMMIYLSEIVSGAISTSAVLLVVTVMSSSGVIISLSDAPVGQPQTLTTEVICSDTNIVATPFVDAPSPDIEQPCIQLQDSPTYELPESRQPWLFWNLSAISVKLIVFLRSTEPSTHTPPRRLPDFSSSSSSIDRFRPLLRESSRLTGDALLPPPADDCLCPVVDAPYTVGCCKPFPGSGYLSSLPECSMVRLVLSAGPSGASDWVGGRDVCDTAGGLISLWIGHSLVGPFRTDDSPIKRIRRYDTDLPRYVQVSGLRRSAAYRWKPGIGITASSCSAIRQHGMSECRSVSILSAPSGSVVVQPRHTCSSARIDVGYCYSPMQHDDCMVTVAV